MSVANFFNVDYSVLGFL